ncbi:MAG: hypothetical protein HYX89_07595 [Chloroflexi bacterium]|nr:hypothetical protein [Chloroflexota bacterium]
MVKLRSLPIRAGQWWGIGVAGALMLALITLLASPTAGDAASRLLSVFRVQKFAPITVDPATLSDLHLDPQAFGTFSGQEPKVRSLASLADAQGLVDFPIRQLSALPAGVSGPTQVAVSEPATLSFTFDAAKTQAALAALGLSANLPKGLDGTTISGQMPASVVVLYSGANSGLAFYQGRAPTWEASEGLDVAALRDLFLSIPGLPPELVAQLAAITDWRTTVPVPVLSGSRADRVTVAGAEGLLITSVSSPAPGAVLVWERDGVLYSLGGSLAGEELLRLASSMR